MAAKLTVLVALTALLGAVAEAVWLAAAQLLATTSGTAAPQRGVWSELIGSAGRGVLLVVLVGLLGFGVANLLRNTAAAFGVGFVRSAVVENALRVLRPRWQLHLTNLHGGLVLAGVTAVVVLVGVVLFSRRDLD